ncbi:glycosyltransferase [Clostridiaceae bacterium]|nr:glycosyltransferase [Clostridiaceae bacterium]
MCKKISVIVPVYNMGQYLSKCVHSLIHQTYNNIEIILINDGSTDNSGELCDLFASQYDNIFVLHQKNSGVSSARNKGLKLATGEYISFVDPDDYLDLETYKIVISLMETYGTEIGCFDFCWFSDKEPIHKSTHNPHYTTQLYSNNHDVVKLLIQSCSACRWIFAKRKLEHLSFPVHITQGEDSVFLTNTLIRCSSALHIKAPFYFRRETPDSATRTQYNPIFLDVFKANKLLENILMQHNKKNYNLVNCVYFHQLTALLYSMKDVYKSHSNDTKYICKKLRCRLVFFIINPYLKIKEKCIICIYCISPSLYYFLRNFYHKLRA